MKRKVILILGATGKIGSELVKALSNENDIIIAYSKNKEKAKELFDLIKDRGNNLLVKVDAVEFSQVKSMFTQIRDKFEIIDFMINCIGISSNNLLYFESIENIDKVIKTNLQAPIYCMKEYIELMLQYNKGGIINLTSFTSEVVENGMAIYSCTKAALEVFSKNLAYELKGNNININCISPGRITSKLNEDLSFDKDEDLLVELIQFIKYFINKKNNKITGQTFYIDNRFKKLEKN